MSDPFVPAFRAGDILEHTGIMPPPIPRWLVLRPTERGYVVMKLVEPRYPGKPYNDPPGTVTEVIGNDWRFLGNVLVEVAGEHPSKIKAYHNGVEIGVTVDDDGNISFGRGVDLANGDSISITGYSVDL